MSVKYICDGCGKEAPADKAFNGDTIKPSHWYSRTDKDGAQHACSRQCIEKAAAKSGKTEIVLPI